MMNAFSALLVACDPVLGLFRSYGLEVGTDLFGEWLVEITYLQHRLTRLPSALRRRRG